jgi:hypothetical protein
MMGEAVGAGSGHIAHIQDPLHAQAEAFLRSMCSTEMGHDTSNHKDGFYYSKASGPGH